MPLSLTLISILLVFLGSAALWDLRQRRIPNALIMAGAIVGILLQGMVAGHGGALAAIEGLGIGLLVLMPGYLMGFTGAGDVKLMAAIGTFLGPYNVFLVALASIAVGGVIALGFAASALFSRNSPSPWPRYRLMVRTLVTTGKPIYVAPAEGEVMGRKFPYAVSIAIGTTLFLLWQSPWLAQ
ncbi:MAG: prepilin peptidase CpaA [Halomonadaceae bacterium T82-2]|nr:MAG: prepilin peptidase CpaA [Halomonadaceae bacterium T82-2]